MQSYFTGVNYLLPQKFTLQRSAAEQTPVYFHVPQKDEYRARYNRNHPEPKNQIPFGVALRSCVQKFSNFKDVGETGVELKTFFNLLLSLTFQ